LNWNRARNEIAFMIYYPLYNITMPHVGQLVHSDTIHIVLITRFYRILDLPLLNLVTQRLFTRMLPFFSNFVCVLHQLASCHPLTLFYFSS
jgi:hypothetical protein